MAGGSDGFAHICGSLLVNVNRNETNSNWNVNDWNPDYDVHAGRRVFSGNSHAFSSVYLDGGVLLSNPFFDRTFIADSFSCRKGKGTHRAMSRFRQFAYKVSKNNTHTCWVLKCDIRKFFASIDQVILLDTVRVYIPDERIATLIAEIVGSFRSFQSECPRSYATARIVNTRKRGLPLGNLTSQLLINVYMNEFDQYVKHSLKAKYCVRYADDFVVLSHDKTHLEYLLPYMVGFLRDRLRLELHPDKVFVKTLASGVDFLGWVHFQNHRVLRTSTKRRMLRNLKANVSGARLASYRGLLSHGNARMLEKRLQ